MMQSMGKIVEFIQNWINGGPQIPDKPLRREFFRTAGEVVGAVGGLAFFPWMRRVADQFFPKAQLDELPGQVDWELLATILFPDHAAYMHTLQGMMESNEVSLKFTSVARNAEGGVTIVVENTVTGLVARKDLFYAAGNVLEEGSADEAREILLWVLGDYLDRETEAHTRVSYGEMVNPGFISDDVMLLFRYAIGDSFSASLDRIDPQVTPRTYGVELSVEEDTQQREEPQQISVFIPTYREDDESIGTSWRPSIAQVLINLYYAQRAPFYSSQYMSADYMMDMLDNPEIMAGIPVLFLEEGVIYQVPQDRVFAFVREANDRQVGAMVWYSDGIRPILLGITYSPSVGITRGGLGNAVNHLLHGGNLFIMPPSMAPEN